MYKVEMNVWGVVNGERVYHEVTFETDNLYTAINKMCVFMERIQNRYDEDDTAECCVYLWDGDEIVYSVRLAANGTWS